MSPQMTKRAAYERLYDHIVATESSISGERNLLDALNSLFSENERAVYWNGEAEYLQAAVCRAVIVLNNGQPQYKAHDILRQALMEYHTGAWLDKPKT